MQIKHQFPPNIEAIRKRFELETFPTVVFTYGDTLYNPLGLDISPDLMAHEETHERQQQALGPDQWWDLYLKDDSFRLTQEVEAYRNQYKSVNKAPREWRRRFLTEIARNLASKLYGSVINLESAKELIKNA